MKFLKSKKKGGMNPGNNLPVKGMNPTANVYVPQNKIDAEFNKISELIRWSQDRTSRGFLPYLESLSSYCKLLKIPNTEGYITYIFEKFPHLYYSIFNSIPLIPNIIMDPNATIKKIPRSFPRGSPVENNKKISAFKNLLAGTKLREWVKQMEMKSGTELVP